MINKLFPILLLLLGALNCCGQKDFVISQGPEPLSQGAFFGFGIQIEADLGVVSKRISSLSADHQKKPVAGDCLTGIAISCSMGVGYNSELRYKTHGSNVWFTPMYHTGFRLSRGRGMLGNSGAYNHRNDHQFELLNSFHMAVGWEENDAAKEFQFFTSNHANSLYLGQKYYLSIGTILINNPKRKETQRSGSIGISVGEFTLFYTNDGGPVIGDLLLGDQWDRYWNGGLAFHYGDLKTVDEIGKIVFSYDRFTGFTKNTYKYAGVLGMDYALYPDKEESAFNKGIWKIRWNHAGIGLGAYFGIQDSKRGDLQHILHKTINVPYHPNFLRRNFHYGASYKY